MVVPNPSALVIAQLRSRPIRIKQSTIQPQCAVEKKVQTLKLRGASTSEQGAVLLAREQLR